MNDKLQKWSLLAEIFGGIAVFITLIILVFEVRRNSEITETLAFQQQIQSLNEWRRSIGQDPDQRRVYAAYFRGENLPETGSEDRLILNFILVDLATNYESAYFSYRAGTLNESAWARIMRNACGFYESAVNHENQWDFIASRLTEDFTEHISADC